MPAIDAAIRNATAPLAADPTLPPPGPDSRDFAPHAQGWRRHAWPGGCFDMAFRPLTRAVEGRMALHHPTIIAVIEGGCRDIEVVSDCGHRYRGADFAGAVSFIPEGAPRHIAMREVRSEWASLSIRPDLFTLCDRPDTAASPRDIPAFTNSPDPFLAAMLGEMRRLRAANDRLDDLYCEAMAISAAHYLARRYGQGGVPVRAGGALPGWRLRRVEDYVAAHLGDQDLRLDDIAGMLGLSTGFFHRAFKDTMGETPLAYIQRQRMEEAMRLLSARGLSVTAVAMRVGFWSPSHFARLFRRHTGLTPSQYRKGRA